MKKILFAASECVPFIKTGGLADVCGALPKEFDKKQWDIRVVIPNYSCIPEQYHKKFSYVTHFYMGNGSYIKDKYVGVLTCKLDGITYYFIDNEEYFTCPAPYGEIRYDIEKFCFFDKAVLSMLPLIGFQPDIIHCHDWETGLIPVYLKKASPINSFFWGMKSILTIHNLKFQGVWDIKTLQGLTGFSEALFAPDKLEYEKDANMLNHLNNKISLISTGINYFGHPNKGTLDTLRNTEILRTDLLNSIKISSDGNLYEIYSYDSHDKKYKLKEKFNSNQN